MISNPEPWLRDLLVHAGLEDMTDEEWEAALERARHSTLIAWHATTDEVPHLEKPQKNFRRSTAESEIDPREDP